MCCQAFKHAKQMAEAEAAQRKTPVKLASADEIRRVLKAKTDYDCLQVRIQHKSMPEPMLLPVLLCRADVCQSMAHMSLVFMCHCCLSANPIMSMDQVHIEVPVFLRNGICSCTRPVL